MTIILHYHYTPLIVLAVLDFCMYYRLSINVVMKKWMFHAQLQIRVRNHTDNHLERTRDGNTLIECVVYVPLPTFT